MNTMLAQEAQSPARTLASDVQPESLSDRVEAIHEMIAGRAYQFFEERGHQQGYDLEDWLRAESDILWPIAVDVYEFEDGMIARAQAPPLTADDIQVTVESRRIIICDKGPKEIETGDDANPLRRLCHIIALPDHLDWTRATTMFEEGMLEISIPKTSPTEALTA